MFNLACRNTNGLQRIMEDVFNNFFDQDLFKPFEFDNFQSNSLNVDVEETDNSYILTADLPGVDKTEIDIDYNNDILSLSVNKKSEKQDSGKKYLRRERYIQSTRRQLKLVNGDKDKVNASLRNGILTIEIEKTKGNTASKRIEIKD